jgi:hypothetical protein
LKPSLGVTAELFALLVLSWLSLLIPGGAIYALYVLIVEFLATYLVHCPAHYVVGTMLGIRFRAMRFGRTTLAEALPPRFSRVARLIPIITLATDRSSLSRAGGRRAAAMFSSGTVASVLAAFAVAASVTPSGSAYLVIAAWAVAIGYLAFDAVFSPRSGDISRARKVRAGSTAEPRHVQK